ncbi:MAG: MoaD/ThiS family protein [Candidatus Bathyarchaeia archaeon]
MSENGICKITVKTRYFGKLRELLGVKNETYVIEKGAAVADLLQIYIPNKHLNVSKIWRETLFRTLKGEYLQEKNGTPVLKNYLVIVNGKSAQLKDCLKEGDEIAIMPPFGGG